MQTKDELDSVTEGDKAENIIKGCYNFDKGWYLSLVKWTLKLKRMGKLLIYVIIKNQHL